MGRSTSYPKSKLTNPWMADQEVFWLARIVDRIVPIFPKNLCAFIIRLGLVTASISRVDHFGIGGDDYVVCWWLSSQICGVARPDVTTIVACLKNPFIFAVSSDVFLKECIAQLGIAGLLSRRAVSRPPPKGFSLNTLLLDRRVGDNTTARDICKFTEP